MKVLRGKYFEDEDGVWQKIEVELTEDDLLSEEAEAPDHTKPTLLEIRAEQYINAFLAREGVISEEQLADKKNSLSSLRTMILSTPALRRKRVEDVTQA